MPLQAGHISSTRSDFIDFIMRAAPARTARATKFPSLAPIVTPHCTRGHVAKTGLKHASRDVDTRRYGDQRGHRELGALCASKHWGLRYR